MAKLKFSSECWTSPTESENGNLIIVTGRADMDNVRETGKFVERVEVTWKYEPEENGMPDFKTSTMMEEITDALNAEFDKDPMAVMTGIYTGDGERNWVFYTMSPHIFGRKFNGIMAAYEVLPITLYVEKDPDWAEYDEMRELSEIKTED